MRVLVRGDVDALARHELAVAEARRACPSTVPSTPCPGIAEKPSTSGSSMPSSLARATTASASGCSELRSSAAASVNIARRVVAVGELDVGHLGLAVRERAGLVEDDRRDLVGGLERVAGLDEDAVLGALAGADHDRGRRGETERARARDDDDGDAGEQRGDPPAVGRAAIRMGSKSRTTAAGIGLRAEDQRDRRTPRTGTSAATRR